MTRNFRADFFFWSGLLVVALLMVVSIDGRKSSSSSANGVSVVQAVAPPFIPFLFNKPGAAEVTVEVKIDKFGNVTAARTVAFSHFSDGSIEDTAKKWRFSTSNEDRERTANLRFVFRIMPDDTYDSELTTIYTAPFQIEVRSKVIPMPKSTSPLPIMN